MPASPFAAVLPGFRIESATVDAERLVIEVEPRRRTAPCPLCAHRSRRVHSHYSRTLYDLPCLGVPTVLLLTLRRFICRNRQCPRRIFCERIPALAGPRIRRTDRLRQTLQEVGFALGGEAGSRLARLLGIPSSPSGLLRLVRLAPNPAIETVRILGVDDWARRRGRSYGTILVDLERHCPIDLVDGRTSEDLAAWLRAHPGIEILSRDRAKEYAEGGRQGAPDAIQVADRWHLLKNLGDVLERALARNHRLLQAAAETMPVAEEPTPAGETELPRAEQERQARRTRRLERYEQVKALHAQGMSISAIARSLGINRRTAQKFVHAEEFPERVRRVGSASPHRYEPYLRGRWEAGCQNVQQLWREICEQGYGGSSQAVRRFVSLWSRTPASRPKPLPQPASPRHAAWLLMRSDDKLTDQERVELDALREQDGILEELYEIAQEFRRLVREQDSQALVRWLSKAAASGMREIRSFAHHLQSDLAALEAALRLPWSNGQTEGQITRLKFLKRQMYGRAKLDLLRIRVLHRG